MTEDNNIEVPEIDDEVAAKMCALAGYDDVTKFKQALSTGKYRVDSIIAAELLSNMVSEIQNYIAFSPVYYEDTVLSEELRDHTMSVLQHLSVMKTLMLMYRSDSNELKFFDRILDHVKAN